ncbi:hypothetical protein, partial [Phytoactinopolyspora halophila]
CVFDPAVLPQSGTYQIVFDPDAAHTGSLTAQLLTVEAPQVFDLDVLDRAAVLQGFLALADGMDN